MIALTDHGDGVAELVLSRRPCNEIGLELLGELERALDALDAAPPRALVILSGVDAGFSAGADLRALYAGISSRPRDLWFPELASFLDRIHTVMSRIDSAPWTTVAAVHGVCFGGGLELALAADVRIAERSARFAFPELRLGLVPGFGGVPRLRRDVGEAAVRDLLLTGRSYSAKKAVEVGLVTQMVPPDRGRDAALATARQCARHDSATVAAAKRFVKRDLAAELAEEKRLFLTLFDRPVVVDALRAFCNSTDLRPYLA